MISLKDFLLEKKQTKKDETPHTPKKELSKKSLNSGEKYVDDPFSDLEKNSETSLKKFLKFDDEEQTEFGNPTVEETDSYKPTTPELIKQYLDSTFKTVEKNRNYGLKYKLNFVDDVGNLEIKYTAIIQTKDFNAEQYGGSLAVKDLKWYTDQYKDESNKIIKSIISNLRSFLNKKIDKNVKIKEENTNDSLELIQSTVNSPRKVYYYRVNCNLSIK